jgi:hypothetical protein
MKRKKIEINESMLMSNEEQSRIKGGERHRERTKNEDGSRTKVVFIT